MPPSEGPRTPQQGSGRALELPPPGESRWEAFERRKRAIADTACSAAEYEERLRELAEELGV